MNITHNREAHRFEMTDESGTPVGQLEYMQRTPTEWLATSTKVFEGYEGHGYAGQLLDALVEAAVQQNATITPLCSYVSAAFKKWPGKYTAVIKK